MPTITDQATAQAVIDAARAHVARMTITPRWRDRLTREAVQLVDAVHEHDRTEAGR